MEESVALKTKKVTLFELLDRILDKGVVIKGTAMISVADVDLIYLDLSLVIGSVDKLLGNNKLWDGVFYNEYYLFILRNGKNR